MDSNIIKLASKRANENMAKNQRVKSLPRPRSVSEVSSARLQERALEAVAPGTGYPELDKIIKGFIPGHLYTLTGDTNVGKTTLACNFAIRVARQQSSTLYFALEPENTVVDYLASVRTNKRFDELTAEDTAEDDGMIHIYGKDEVGTIEDMVQIIDTIENRYNLIVIDHIGYFLNGGNNWLTEQSNAIKMLAALAKRKQVAILIIAHLRKKSSNARKDYTPTSDDIAGSGAFKQDSTEVMIVTRDVINPQDGGMEYGNTGKLFVTKTKCGPNGTMTINFQDRKANIYSDGEIMSGRYREHYTEKDDAWMDEVNNALFE